MWNWIFRSIKKRWEDCYDMTDGEKLAKWQGFGIGVAVTFLFSLVIFSLGFYYKVSQL